MRLVTTLAPVADGVRIALDAIRANVVRAALTMLGVAVGAFVVVVISAIIQGINEGASRDFEAAGPTSFFVQRFPDGFNFTVCDGSEDSCKWLHNPPITASEVAALHQLPSVLAASAKVSTQAPVVYRNRHVSGLQIVGDSPEWIQVDGGSIDAGRSFTAAENSAGAQVAVVNGKMASQLFGSTDPIGKVIKVRGTQLNVIGVYRDPISFLNGSGQPKAIIPLETARRSLHVNYEDLTLTIKPLAHVARDDAVDEVTVKLRELRGLKPGVESNFAIMTQDQLFDTYRKTTGTFFLVMIVLSAVGLVVGGVGVVAIMMISVTERTREIGVRKALGATRWMILWQFLVESVTLTGAGAAVGLVLGWVVATLVRRFTSVPADIPLWAILAALAASAITGVAFGTAPALRAARLDPVEALRYE